MAGSTTKKVVIRRFDREPLQGFVNSNGYLQDGGVEFLSPSGAVALLPYADLKSLIFVKEFESGVEPAKLFQTRPKMEGLWVRMTFRDRDVMDGILPNNPLVWESKGYLFTPPEPYSNNQRLFVPKQALVSMSVLGVVGSPLTRERKKKPALRDQPTLFD